MPSRPPAISSPSAGRLIRRSLHGMRQNLLPGLVLQGFALLVVVGYYQAPSVAELLNQVGQIKAQYGYLYSAIATGIFGGFIPYVILLGTGNVPRSKRLPEFLFYNILWAWKGIEVDSLYRLQAWLFGGIPGVSGVVLKTLADQLIYNPLWAAPTQMLLFLWKDSGFSWSAVRTQLRLEPFLPRAVVVTFSSLVVWFPAVALIYSLPNALQIPLFNLVLCFWSLLLSFISRESKATAADLMSV